MPIPEDVRDFLGDLLGRPVSVTKASTRLDFTDDPERWVTGLYVDDHGTLIGACISDLSLAGDRRCAALAMMPAAAAEEAVDSGRLDDGLRDNFYEVANILSRLLNGPSVPHLRLTELVDGVPDEVVRADRSAARAGATTRSPSSATPAARWASSAPVGHLVARQGACQRAQPAARLRGSAGAACAASTAAVIRSPWRDHLPEIVAERGDQRLSCERSVAASSSSRTARPAAPSARRPSSSQPRAPTDRPRAAPGRAPA